MRKEINLVITLLLVYAATLHCQEDNFTVLYTNTTSGITYAGSGHGGQRVYSGISLPAKGKLVLKKGSFANVVYKEQKKRLEGPGSVDLNQLASSIDAEEKPGFLSRFWRFLGNSINKTNSTPKLEKYHQQYLTNARAGVEGWGERNFDIHAPLYSTEILGHSPVQFRWNDIETLQGYTFSIEARNDGKLIYKASTKSNLITIDLEELNIEPGAVYRWKVTGIQAEKPLAESPSFEFIYAPDDLKELMEALMAEEDYKELEPFEQILYIAQNLEEEGFFQSAHAQYLELIENEPDNQLFKKVFAAFLARMNALDEAKQQLQ